MQGIFVSSRIRNIIIKSYLIGIYVNTLVLKVCHVNHHALSITVWKKYFDKTQDTYLRCKENQEELIREYKEGNVSQEQVENYQKYLADLKLNYDRLAYIMYLLGTPQRKSKKGKYDEANKDLVNYFKENKATKEDVYLENKYSL